MTTEKKYLTITMSERSPIKIDKAEWPTIADVSEHDGVVRSQANTEWYIRVREHADGRRIVYGARVAGGGGQHVGFREDRAGFLVDVPRNFAGSPVDMTSDGVRHSIADETIRAIRRVAGIVGDDKMGDECIGSLPAESI
jgi:hypothetical protein